MTCLDQEPKATAMTHPYSFAHHNLFIRQKGFLGGDKKNENNFLVASRSMPLQ